MTKKFKHSGTLGDIIQSMAIVKYLGGGEFYLHLNQVDWIAKHYYNSEPHPFHKGKMTEKDFSFMKRFFEAQSYITKFSILNNDVEITHNLDRFRPLFVYHPANYVSTYCMAFGIKDKDLHDSISKDPWLECPDIKKIDKSYVINRTSRFTEPGCNEQWKIWKDQGMDEDSIFVGLENEYDDFKKLTGWNLEYHPTKDMLELAQVISGCKKFIGNQSVALSLAQGLGVPYLFETRRDLPMERNENFYHNHPHGGFF